MRYTLQLLRRSHLRTTLVFLYRVAGLERATHWQHEFDPELELELELNFPE